MDLVVDASALVGELLRRRGRQILAHPELSLYIAPPQWDEALHELDRRVRHVADRLGKAAEELLTEAQALAEVAVVVVPEEVYSTLEEEARRRIEDPDDWPTVALALALDAGVWTSDLDFFGSGVATWKTETLLQVLRIEA